MSVMARPETPVQADGPGDAFRQMDGPEFAVCEHEMGPFGAGTGSVGELLQQLYQIGFRGAPQGSGVARPVKLLRLFVTLGAAPFVGPPRRR
jgi:hypothetical protein